MKIGLLVSTVAVLIAAAAYTVFVNIDRQLRPGELTVIPETLEYSEEAGDSKSLPLTLKNTGGRPVTLESVTAGCACTNVTLPDQRVLQPGEEQRVLVSVQPPSYGTRESYLELLTDSLPTMRVPVILRGGRLDPPYFRSEPSELRYEFGAGIDARKLEFEVLCVESRSPTNWLQGFTEQTGELLIHEPVIVDRLEVGDDAVMTRYRIDVEWRTTQTGRAESSLTTTLVPEMASPPKRPEPRIPVHLKTVAALKAIPSALVFTVDRESADTPAVTRRVIIRSTTGDEWRISSVQTSERWLAAVVPEADDETKPVQTIDVSVDPMMTDAQTEVGVVDVETTHPLCPRMTIKVYATGDANDARP